MQGTLFDIPTGPYLLEIKGHGENAAWTLIQSVKTEEEGLRIASNMSPYSNYRLYIGPAWGYKYLEWEDDKENKDMCVPVWKYPEDCAV